MTSTKKIPTILCASPWPPIEIPTTFLSEKNCELLTQKSSDAGSIVRKPPNESVYLVVQFYQVRVPGTAMFWCWLSVWRECRPPDTDPQFARWSADHRLRSTDVRDDLHLSLSLSLSLSFSRSSRPDWCDLSNKSSVRFLPPGESMTLKGFIPDLNDG